MCGKKSGSSAKPATAAAKKPVTSKKATPAQKKAAPKATTKAAAPKATTKKAAPTAPVAAVSTSNPAGDYTVLAGDTLSKIANQLNVAGGWQSLAEKNKNFISDPNLILVGQKIATK
ncbi:LysM peptidoglycan-binding domain-containing protein [Actinokineospora sp. PR83]|nr:LysM peptidoglycan-binding domain-containing protein [Actinokineospora sp. PR83]